MTNPSRPPDDPAERPPLGRRLFEQCVSAAGCRHVDHARGLHRLGHVGDHVHAAGHLTRKKAADADQSSHRPRAGAGRLVEARA